jgi:hypothetical protein
LDVIDCGVSTAEVFRYDAGGKHGIDMTLVLYEMWDSTVWDWRPSSTTVIEGARSTQASVTGKLYSLKDGLSRYWFLAGDQRTGSRYQYVRRHDLLDHNTVKGSEAILDGYWILSLTPSWFSGYLTKLFQVTKLNSVEHHLISFIMHLYNNVTNEWTELLILSIPLCVLQYIKIMISFVQSNTTYFSGGNMFHLNNKSSSGHPVT